MNKNLSDNKTDGLLRELKFTRIICMISSVLTLCLLLGGVILYGRVRELSEICEPAVEKISDIDMKSFNDTLNHVNATLERVDWEQVADSLGKLDVDAINSAIEGLDTKELSETLKNLNDAVEKIKELGERLSSLPAWLNDKFGKG